MESNAVSSLSSHDKLLLMARLLGYREMPVDITTFVNDPYYLGKTFGGGKLFPAWLDVLKQMFPDPIRSPYLVVVLTGAIGTGKSTLSKIAALYTEYKVNCLIDPPTTFNLADTKGIQFIWFHVSGEKAYKDFITSIRKIKKESAYWSNTRYKRVSHVIDGVRTNNSIGSDILYYNLSELAFVKPEVAKYKLTQALQRFESRFQTAIGFFGTIVIDSSARTDNSIVDNYINNNPFSAKGMVLTVRMSIWKAKSHLGIYFNEGSFKVYIGDANNKAHIIRDDEDISKLDPDRIEVVPNELRSNFEQDLIGSLQDKAGISTRSTSTWLPDPNIVYRSFSRELTYPETISVDFYDLEDGLYDRLAHVIDTLPKDRIYYLRFDLGIVRDRCGMALGYVSDYKVEEVDGIKIALPIYSLPIILQISHKSKQQTSLTHIYGFILKLSKVLELGDVSFDQFASVQILQDLTRAKIPCKRISVDRTTNPYNYFKTCMMKSQIDGVNNPLLIKEVLGLRYTKGKIDHAPGGITTKNSMVPGKDIADAVSGCIWDMYGDGKKAARVSKAASTSNQLGLLRTLAGIDPVLNVQSMINNIWES